jgi:hypothetical protein
MYKITTAQGMVEHLSYKIGGFSINLGASLFFNLFLLFKGKNLQHIENILKNWQYEKNSNSRWEWSFR